MYQEEKRDEFLHLKQDELSVAEYKKFTELTKYAMTLIDYEAERCRQFVRGLRGKIRTSVVPIVIRSDYAYLVDVALWVEKSLGMKRPSYELSEEESGSVETKKAKTIVSQGSHWTSDQKPQCRDCGRTHMGICRRRSIACY
ncbi:hypothetical protein E5676_scaffold313G001620 [Cucumis melo var. makuwa]|uniref:Uncharacterized protein n=1 Tax=Cucumis melo var. makuwa TaxID=1194695 RepID=A0A5D3DS44_CUCMM|nr:hypothetical protein E6C27_scaffold154G002300 [Cucumis melo var. makuwa]TYK26561.1 hypothetical protein E5676_scaffold313G001620 [Cucumis melo var. makuwa]